MKVLIKFQAKIKFVVNKQIVFLMTPCVDRSIDCEDTDITTDPSDPDVFTQSHCSGDIMFNMLTPALK